MTFWRWPYTVPSSTTPPTVCLQLPSLGVDPKCITFVNVTMESDKFVCVRETGANNSVVIIDMAQPNTPLRRPITADSALMNPVSKIIALKASAGAAGDSLQIFNLETKSKVKSFQIAQSVPFWKWISSTKLGLVTATTVYHWDINVRPSLLQPCLSGKHDSACCRWHTRIILSSMMHTSRGKFAAGLLQTKLPASVDLAQENRLTQQLSTARQACQASDSACAEVSAHTGHLRPREGLRPDGQPGGHPDHQLPCGPSGEVGCPGGHCARSC